MIPSVDIYIISRNSRPSVQPCSYYGNVKVGEDEGLICLYTLVSGYDDWDHYETLQWWAIDEYIRVHPDDPDVHELVERKTREKNLYLLRGR